MQRGLFVLGTMLVLPMGCFQATADAETASAEDTEGETDAGQDATGADATATSSDPKSDDSATSTSGPGETGDADDDADETTDGSATDSTSGAGTTGSEDDTTGDGWTGSSEGGSSESTGDVDPTSCIDAVDGAITLTFGTLPDGTAVDQRTILDGDEFACAGVTNISGIGLGATCPDDLGAQLVVSTSCTSSAAGPFMQSYYPENPTSCDGGGLRFSFESEVDSVEVEFAGASVEYELIGYRSGQEIASASAMGVCNGAAVSVSIDAQQGFDEVAFVRPVENNAFHNIRRLTFVPQ